MSICIRNASVVNEGQTRVADVWIEGEFISKITSPGEISQKANQEIDATGLLLIPGAIDDQVHFREPGLTHKGEIYTEARAAVAGGAGRVVLAQRRAPPLHAIPPNRPLSTPRTWPTPSHRAMRFMSADGSCPPGRPLQ